MSAFVFILLYALFHSFASHTRISVQSWHLFSSSAQLSHFGRYSWRVTLVLFLINFLVVMQSVDEKFCVFLPRHTSALPRHIMLLLRTNCICNDALRWVHQMKWESLFSSYISEQNTSDYDEKSNALIYSQNAMSINKPTETETARKRERKMRNKHVEMSVLVFDFSLLSNCVIRKYKI